MKKLVLAMKQQVKENQQNAKMVSQFTLEVLIKN